MLLSIIIPTKNEEKYLPILLKSIHRQNLPKSDYEIIVADNNSTDRTREIAKKYNCKITKGGLPGPGRSFGAKAAKGEILLFLDADTQLSQKDFLKSALGEMKSRRIDIAVPKAEVKGNKADKFFTELWNYLVEVSQYVSPFAGGWCIFVRKKIHDKIKGFNEKIILGEDSDYAKRAAKFGKFRMLGKAKIRMSTRRLKKEGHLKVAFQILGIGLYWAMFGRDKKNRLKYNFDIYGKGNSQK